MPFVDKIFPLLYFFPPEKAHKIAILGLQLGFAGRSSYKDDKSLYQKIWGLEFSNPLCLAAGFDKNAVAVSSLFSLGFSAIEVGTVTPLPQSGNSGPRLFLLKEDEAIINALGFNSKGMKRVAERLRIHEKRKNIIGVNIGKNRRSTDSVGDFRKAADYLIPYADYITINVSSPNTPGLRALQNKESLRPIIDAVVACREQKKLKTPILVKLSPDLFPYQAEELAMMALENPIDGFIIGNTTLSRPLDLASPEYNRQGGLSGAPLKKLSTDLLRCIYRICKGKIPLIAAGGVSSAEDAYQKICSGASLVQLYTGLIYKGPRLIEEMKRGLAVLVKKDGFDSVTKAIGKNNPL